MNATCGGGAEGFGSAPGERTPLGTPRHDRLLAAASELGLGAAPDGVTHAASSWLNNPGRPATDGGTAARLLASAASAGGQRFDASGRPTRGLGTSARVNPSGDPQGPQSVASTASTAPPSATGSPTAPRGGPAPEDPAPASRTAATAAATAAAAAATAAAAAALVSGMPGPKVYASASARRAAESAALALKVKARKLAQRSTKELRLAEEASKRQANKATEDAKLDAVLMALAAEQAGRRAALEAKVREAKEKKRLADEARRRALEAERLRREEEERARRAAEEAARRKAEELKRKQEVRWASLRASAWVEGVRARSFLPKISPLTSFRHKTGVARAFSLFLG